MHTDIRPATEADVERLVELSRHTIAASYTSFFGSDAVAAFLDSGAVEEYVRQSIERCVVIVEAQQLLGCTVTDGNLIDLMMIDASHHRRSLGSTLLAHVEGTLFAGHESLRLESFQANAPANAFYRKHGWVEQRTFFDDDSGLDKIEFGKSRP